MLHCMLCQALPLFGDRHSCQWGTLSRRLWGVHRASAACSTECSLTHARRQLHPDLPMHLALLGQPRLQAVLPAVRICRQNGSKSWVLASEHSGLSMLPDQTTQRPPNDVWAAGWAAGGFNRGNAGSKCWPEISHCAAHVFVVQNFQLI